MSHQLLLLLILGIISVTSAVSYSCPDGSKPITSNIDIATCQDPQPDGSCPSGSDGLSLTITGDGNVPKFTWGLLQNGQTYKVMFQQFFEIDPAGARVAATTNSLPSWDWTFCSPFSYSNNTYSEIILDFFGTNDGAGMYVSAVIINASNTSSFKWSLNIDDYPLHGNTNLVLFSKYQNQKGQSSISTNDDGDLVNGNSFIQTSLNATFDNTVSVNVYTSNLGDSKSGYYIIFDLIAANVNPSENFHLYLDPTFGISSASTFVHSLLLTSTLFILLLF